MTERIKTLMRYRDERERQSINTVGEASGRIYKDDVETIKKLMPKSPMGSKGFVQAFKIILDNSPVVIREDELIVGDYYYLMPFELIEMPYFFDDHGVQVSYSSGHTVVDIEKLLRTGLGGIKNEIKISRQKQTEREKIEYLIDLEEVVNLMQGNILKYASQANRMYERTGDKQYLVLKDKLELISENPADGLHSAFLLYFLYITYERTTSAGMGACRLDQVFYPYYRHDIKKGVLNRQQVLELVQALFLKEGLFHSLGGVLENGEDAVNQLSFIALEAYDEIGGPSNLNVKWHSNINNDFFDKAISILEKHKNGVPNIVNDEVVVKSLEHWGFTQEQARRNAFAGCFWYVVPAMEYPYHDMEAISAVDIFYDTLKEKEYSTYKSFYDAFIIKQKQTVDRLVKELAKIDSNAHKMCPEMVISLFTDGCIEKGVDITNNGANKSMTTVLYVGLATVSDSLYSLKQLVFDKKEYSYSQFIDALDKNFKDNDKMYSAIRRLHKYGNDEDDVDQIATQLAEDFKVALKQHKNSKGFSFRPAFYSWNRHIFVGNKHLATPDGRKQGKPVSQGINPTHGKSEKGLTAFINSVSKINSIDTAGSPMHIHISGNISKDMVKTLVKTAFKKGIIQVIANYVDGETLKKAYENPEDYWDLVIRVTGYSARFVQIDKNIQREIIERYIY